MPNNHLGQDVMAAPFPSQLDRTSEFEIPNNGLLTVHTRNSIYQFDLDSSLARGGAIGGEWTPAKVQGATFGGSMIMTGRLLEGSLMEFIVRRDDGQWSTMVTSPVSAIRYRKSEDL